MISREMSTIPFKCRMFISFSEIPVMRDVTGIDCKKSLIFDFSEADITCNLWRSHRVYDRYSHYIPKTFSSHNAKWLVSQRRLGKIHKRFSGAAAIFDPQVGLTVTLQTSLRRPLFTVFTSFRSAIALSVYPLLRHYWPLLAPSGFLRKVNNILIGCHLTARWVVDIIRLHINKGVKQNKQWASCRHFLFLFPTRCARTRFPFSLPLSRLYFNHHYVCK